MKTFIFLLIASLAIICSLANGQTVCPVAESEKELGFGLCQSRGKLNVTKCQERCQKYANVQNKEVVVSECSMANENADCKPVCICKLKCFTAGSGGDPHYFSWDIPAPTFDYMSLKKHYLIKPCQKYTTLPNFEIRQTNRPYSGAISVADTVELVVPEWERVLQVKIPMAPGGVFEVTVNGRKRDIPYHYPDPELGTCNSDTVKVYFKDPATKSQIIVETSFGVRINIAYASVIVDIPQHPELKTKACGILGTPNGNPADDCRLSTGESCTHQPGWDQQGVLNRPFGDSWIVPGNGAWMADCFPPEELKKTEDIIKNTPPEVKKRIEQLCKNNAGNPDVVKCAKKLGRPARSVEECIFDAQFLATEKEQKEFVKTIVQATAVACDVDIPFKEGPQAAGCCMKNLAPLYRMWLGSIDDHFYTVSLSEALNAQNQIKYNFEGSQAFVATSPNDCSCGANPTALKPVFRMFKSAGGKGDHFYTTCPLETGRAVKELGYKQEGIAFYCVEKDEGKCGATVPMFRVLRVGGNDHFYTTDEAEAKQQIAGGGSDEDILCFVWPNAQAVTQQ